jgi:signal transduction histidine kinase/ligand-binding sensor domain-containing protein
MLRRTRVRTIFAKAFGRFLLGIQGCAVLLCALLWAVAAWPLSPDTKMADLNRTSWSAKDGAPAGGVNSIVQTADGFLWLASLGFNAPYRFDGRRFESIELPRVGRSSTPLIFSLFAPKAGGLWIGFTFGGAAFFKDGRMTSYSEKDGLPSGSVRDFAEGSDGVIWAATTRGVARLVSNRWALFADLNAIGADPVAMMLDTEGTLWLACLSRLLFWPKGATSFQEIPVSFRTTVREYHGVGIAESASGVIWMADDDGIHPIRKVENASGRAVNTGMKSGLLIDREGSIWSTYSPIRRIAHPPALREPGLIGWKDPRWVDVIGPVKEADARGGGLITHLLEDREGDMWLGTPTSLHRFSDQNLRRAFEAPRQEFSIGAADDGGLWVAARMKLDPIWKFEGGKLEPRTAPQDAAVSCQIRARDGSTWFGTGTSLLHVAGDELRASARLLKSPEKIALPPDAQGTDVQALAEDQSGAIWVSVIRKGVFRLAGGVWSQNGGLATLPKLTAVTLSPDSKGRVWIGYTENRMAVVDGSSVHLFSETDGLEIGNVTAIYAQRSRTWAGGDGGLAVFDGRRFQAVRSEEPRRLQGITGIVETADGDVWLNGNAGIVHITAPHLRSALAGTSPNVESEVFGARDGLEGRGQALRGHPTVVEGTDGKLWFSTNVAVFYLDPAHLARNPVAPPVVITSLKVGDKSYSATDGVVLPNRSTALRIGYVGLSLMMPEKVRYRYKLDGVDEDWRDAQEMQEANYVNVSPGSYRFHVIAANNDGVWNDQGATLDFVIPAMFTQKPWFIALCIFATAVLIAFAFRLRMHQIAAKMRLRLNERLRERERIARELHDTLLQSTQGLMLRVQAARNRILPGDPAREVLDSALKRADEVLAEARDRVQDLRIPAEAGADLAKSLSVVGEELALGRTVTLKVSIEGTPRSLRSKIVDDTYNIGREALLNAFHHAQATAIELLIVYGTRDLRVCVRDDGCGIDSDVLDQGSRAGHWGLRGMRERAHEIGAHLEIRSRRGSGTEVDVLVPSAFVGAKHQFGPGWLRFLRARRVPQ